MERSLNNHERRVLGVLIEKSMTQPEYYPMTVNAIVTACNQRSNRDPIMDLDDVAVQATLDVLRKRGLVEQLLPAPGARTDRFKHKVESQFGWSPRERAIMTELFLRGPQTAGELRTHGERMAGFEDLQIVMNVLDTLGSSDPPMVALLPRQSGRTAPRYTHLFYPQDEAPPTASAPPAAPVAALPHAVPPATRPTPGAADDQPLRSEINDLHEEMALVIEELADLRRRIEAIESRS